MINGYDLCFKIQPLLWENKPNKYRIYEICDWSSIQDSERNSIIKEMEKAKNRERTEELLKYHLNRE